MPEAENTGPDPGPVGGNPWVSEVSGLPPCTTFNTRDGKMAHFFLAWPGGLAAWVESGMLHPGQSGLESYHSSPHWPLGEVQAEALIDHPANLDYLPRLYSTHSRDYRVKTTTRSGTAAAAAATREQS